MFVFHFSVSEPLCLVVVNVVGVPRARFQYLSVTGYCVNIMHVYVYALKIYTFSFCPPGPMHYFISLKASNSLERISLSRALSVIIILYQVIIWTKPIIRGQTNVCAPILGQWIWYTLYSVHICLLDVGHKPHWRYFRIENTDKGRNIDKYRHWHIKMIMIKHWDNCHIFYMDIIVIGHRLLMVCAWLGGTIPMGLEHFPWWLHRLHTLDIRPSHHSRVQTPEERCHVGRFHDTRVDPSSARSLGPDHRHAPLIAALTTRAVTCAQPWTRPGRGDTCRVMRSSPFPMCRVVQSPFPTRVVSCSDAVTFPNMWHVIMHFRF